MATIGKTPSVTVPPVVAGAPDRPRRGARASMGAHSSVWALLGFTLLSCLLYGRGVLPHLGSTLVGSGPTPAYYGRDQGAYTWFLAWGGYVLEHPQDPFMTHLVYAPGGYNLAWAASLPGPSLLLAPLTALVGAIPVFNLLALLSPALAAWTAYLFCVELTGERAPAVLGGLLFGFGSYETTETVNHLNLALVALLPLLPLLALRRWRERISARKYVLGVGAVAAAQLWTSTEVFASAAVFGTLALLLALTLAARADRHRAVRLLGESFAALGFAVVLGAPLLLSALGPNPVASHSTVNGGADLANFLVPTHVTWLHQGPGIGSPHNLAGSLTEHPDYLGPVLIGVLVWFAIVNRRSRLAWGVLIFGLSAALLSLGGRLIIDRHGTGIWLPWDLIGQIGPLRYALPDRFAVYVWLAAAACIALLVRGRSFRSLPWIAAIAACLSVLANPSFAWSTHVDSPPLLRGARFASYVKPGSTVLALPFGREGDSMLWQVESHFSFALAGGYVSWALPGKYRGLTILRELDGRPPGGRLKQRLCEFLAMTHTETILLREHTRGDFRATLSTLGVAPVRAGGFKVYRVADSSCPHP
jgi:hypothetical protein